MLQQTQVTTVIPYFERFIAQFPDVEALAAADTEQVLALWTGLGYYRRARNLQAAARQVCDRFAGQFPHQPELLASLPGIGRSTAAAIASIAFEQPAAILDGNVKRVLCRHAGVFGQPQRSAVDKQLWQLAEARLPSADYGRYTQAIMDFGATLCKSKKPECGLCPVADDCQALLNDWVTILPERKPTKIKPVRSTLMLMLVSDQGVYLEPQLGPGVWSGLWCFPRFEALTAAEDWLASRPWQPLTPGQNWPEFRHTFSHYHLDIVPRQQPVRLQGLAEGPGRFVAPGQWSALGLPAPVLELLQRLDLSP